jgi:hypothetical protein
MSPNFDPPISPEHWGGLPFPFGEMQGSEIEVIMGAPEQSTKALLFIDRHPTDDTLFSAVIIISDLPGWDWAVSFAFEFPQIWHLPSFPIHRLHLGFVIAFLSPRQVQLRVRAFLQGKRAACLV